MARRGAGENEGGAAARDRRDFDGEHYRSRACEGSPAGAEDMAQQEPPGAGRCRARQLAPGLALPLRSALQALGGLPMSRTRKGQADDNGFSTTARGQLYRPCAFRRLRR